MAPQLTVNPLNHYRSFTKVGPADGDNHGRKGVLPMLGNTENDLAKLRAVPRMRPMEESGDGDAQTSPGYDDGGAAATRKGFVERRRRPRRGPWTADASDVAQQTQALTRVCLIPEPSHTNDWRPVALSMATLLAARSGTKGRSLPGLLIHPLSGSVGSAKRAL